MQVECQLANFYSKWQPTAMGPPMSPESDDSRPLLQPLFSFSARTYAGFALLWVWILSFTPLSRAYPFVALAFALTPLLAGSLFGETISLRLIIGLLLILGGLFFVSA
jgi:drug/metabolite transporter (DMT)-like permease